MRQWKQPRKAGIRVIDERIEADIAVNGPPEMVWEAWANPVHLARWFVDEARGRIGEDERVTWIWEQMGVELEYEVVAAEPGRRFELRAGTPDGGTRITEVALGSDEDGATRVRVAESGFGVDAGAVRSGWKMALGLLKVYVEDYWDWDVRSVVVMGKAEGTPDEILALQRTADGLDRWLDIDGALPEEGERVRLDFEEGLVLEGRVLRRTALETSLTWPWIQGVLEIKQFPVPDGRAAALRAFTWADESEVDLAALQEALTPVLARFLEALE